MTVGHLGGGEVAAGALHRRDRVRTAPSTTAFGGGPPPRAGEDFGSAAVRLAGFCCVRLGWSPAAFWAATPAEVAAVVAALLPPAGDAPVLRDDLERMETADG